MVFKLLENEDDVVIKHGTQSRENRREVKQGMHTSKFCLHLDGATAACRLFDSIASLCVPVIVSDSTELPFEDVIDYRKFCIFLRSDAALKPGFVVKKLRKVKPQKILKYQKAMKEVKSVTCPVFSTFPLVDLTKQNCICENMNFDLCR